MRLRCQKGIPPALRGRTWLYLSGGKVKKEQNQGKFQVRQVPLSVLYSVSFLSVSGYVETFRCHFYATVDSSPRTHGVFNKAPVITRKSPPRVLTGAGQSAGGSQMGRRHREGPASTVPFSRDVCGARRTRVGGDWVVPQTPTGPSEF